MAKSKKGRNASSRESTLRIIAGDWRGRKVSFYPAEGLRPTNDRVRETLFNWLMLEIPGAHCLDLFAGSGALGFEAISRGAGQVLMVELNKSVANEIKKNLSLLETDNGNIIQADAVNWLSQTKPERPFDIIFLDPPFHQGLLPQIIPLLSNQSWLQKEGKLYIELENKTEVSDQIKPLVEIEKEKNYGQVKSILARLKQP